MDIDPALPRFFKGDPVRTKQIFANLISNALKFTSEGHVFVSAKKLGGEDGFDCIGFTVADTGIGIPKDKQEKVFEKFSQAEESTTRKFGGTGLGLTIVSELIDLMGGSIHVESEVGQGSKFILKFDKIGGDVYLTSDYSDEFKIVFNERSMGLYLKATRDLIQVRRKAIIKAHEHLNED